MLRMVNEYTLEGVAPASDCENNFKVSWLSKASTGSFYIGDKKHQREAVAKFITGKHECLIDSKSFFKYIDDVEEIVKKYKHMFYGPVSVLSSVKAHFKGLPEQERVIYISYDLIDPVTGDENRYLKTSKNDPNVAEFKSILASNITNVKITKENGKYKIFLNLVDEWRDNVMKKVSKCDTEKVVSIFNDYVTETVQKGKSIQDACMLFGIKYEPLIKNNGIDINELVKQSRYSSEENFNALLKGIKVSSEVLWETKGEAEEDEVDNFKDVLNHNVFGMHITRTNNALDEENPHICIGWGKLGDLSEINTKEALSTLYDTQFEKTKMGKAQDISQIWTFRGIMSPGDYVVFGDGGIAHIGRIVSDYYYDTTNENQDEDYVNNRKVEWLKSIPYADLPTNLRKSIFSQRSIFSLNDYKSVIIDLLNDKYVEAIEEEIAVFIPYTYDTAKGGAQNKVIYG